MSGDKIRINVNLFPKDGYFFRETDGASIRAETWKGVIARVKEYRRINNLPAGNPEDEVIAQACQRNPSFCSKETEKQREQTRKVSVKGRVLSWLSNLRKKKETEEIPFVEPALATERARICMSCPQNTPIADGCSSCKAALAEYRRGLLNNRNPTKHLNGCAVLGEDTCVSIHLDDQRVENNELPSNCWRKRGV